MTRPLYQLGDFQFDLPNGAPQTLDWDASYRWEEQGRLLRDPAQQFVGPGSQTITLDGVLFPGFSGRQSTMEQLRGIAREGEPLMLTDGMGKVYGKWAIKSLREGKGVFMDNGAARQIQFSVQLVFYGEDNPGEAASPFSMDLGSGFIGSLTQNLSGVNFTGTGSAFGALDWSQASQFQGLTQQAMQSGFSLGQLASIASTGASIATQVASGNYVSAALGTFGMLGIPVDQNDAWTQIGINAAGLAQSYATGNGPTGMALALQAATLAGGPALVESGIVAPADAPAISSLLQSTATLATILEVDPQITAGLSNSVLLP
jgi:phage protein U